MRLELDLREGIELVQLSFTRGAKDWLWFASARVAGKLGTLQGRPGDTAQQAIDNATAAALQRDEEITVRHEPAVRVDLTNL